MHNYEGWLAQLSSKKPSVGMDAAFLEGCPELLSLINLEQDPQAHPEGCVWVHTTLVVDNAAKTKKRVPSEWRVPYLFAALLHDTGKAGMEQPDAHFTGHSNYSVRYAAEFLIRIGAPDDVVKNTVNLVRWHHSPFELAEGNLDNWRLVAEQVPLKVLAWFSRCDSFAGARRNELPVQAVHAASERTLRAAAALAAEEEKPEPIDTQEFRAKVLGGFDRLNASLEKMATRG